MLSSAENGCVPTTGMLAADRMGNTCAPKFEVIWTAVTFIATARRAHVVAPVGDSWSSQGMMLIGRPPTPPALLIASAAAFAPAIVSGIAPAGVLSVAITSTLIGVPFAFVPVLAVVEVVVDAGALVVDELLLPHAAAPSATVIVSAAITTARLTPSRLGICTFPPSFPARAAYQHS